MKDENQNSSTQEIRKPSIDRLLPIPGVPQQPATAEELAATREYFRERFAELKI